LPGISDRADYAFAITPLSATPRFRHCFSLARLFRHAPMLRCRASATPVPGFTPRCRFQLPPLPYTAFRAIYRAASRRHSQPFLHFFLRIFELAASLHAEAFARIYFRHAIT
jgi:hypothetical protein